MVNHFRSLLLNLSDQGDSSEFIPSGFVARPLQDELLLFYKLLFPDGSSRSDILRLGQAYLEIVSAAGLSEVFTIVDPRISYDLQTDFDNFKNTSIVLSDLNKRLTSNTGIVNDMLSVDKKVDTTKYDNLWYQHYNNVYKLAGLIAAYVLRLE